jgi:hypothetical protein
LYNFDSLRQSEFVIIPLIGNEQMAERLIFSRRGLVMLLASFALTVSLASRCSTPTFSKAPVALSNDSKAKIQRLDKDAEQWVAPAATFTLLRATEPTVILDGDEKIPTRLPDDSLHNRPPPLS